MSSLDAVRARFPRNEGLPFADILTEASIQKVLNEYDVSYRDRVFSPVTTIWGFLSQVLNEDHSCRDTVSRIIAHRTAHGMAVCSPNTASYCTARSRIPTPVLSTLARRTAEELHASVDDRWKWNGRSVFILDGSSVSMPDTPENRAMYPQPPNQKPGLGFPLARITVLLSLASGACHDLAIAPYAGKGTGEKSLLPTAFQLCIRQAIEEIDQLPQPALVVAVVLEDHPRQSGQGGLFLLFRQLPANLESPLGQDVGKLRLDRLQGSLAGPPVEPQHQLAMHVAHAVIDAEESQDLLDGLVHAVGPPVKTQVLGADQALGQELLLDERLRRGPVVAARLVQHHHRHQVALAGLQQA